MILIGSIALAAVILLVLLTIGVQVFLRNYDD